MSFDTPQFLFLLILLVPLFFVMLLRRKKRREGVIFLSSNVRAEEREALRTELNLRIILSDLFFLFFAALIILSLSGPRWGVEIKAEERRGLDLVLAFDISRSMNVRDCPPLQGRTNDSSRLERALSIARDLCFRLGEVRLGVAAGKGTGVLMVPLTFDSEAVLSILDSLDDSFLSGTGTNLESLIDASGGAFRKNMNGHRGILLFSDGEILSGSLDIALDRLRSDEIILSAIGLGSDGGGPVPVNPGPSAPAGILLGQDGSPLISSLQEEFLRNAVRKSGGIYVDAGRNDAVSLLADYYRSFSMDSITGRREAIPRWQFFVISGLVCFGFSRLLGYRRKKMSRISVLLCLISFLGSSCSKIQGNLFIMEGNFYNSRHRYNEAINSYLKARNFENALPYAEYGLGSVYSSMEEKEAALDRYADAEKNLELLKAGEHPELRYRLKYNTGIIYFEQGDFSQAALSFRKALELDSGRLEAKQNLELSLLALSRPNQSEPQSSAPETEQSGDASPALYDYIRLKEQEQWKSREWTGESGSDSPDY